MVVPHLALVHCALVAAGATVPKRSVRATRRPTGPQSRLRSFRHSTASDSRGRRPVGRRPPVQVSASVARTGTTIRFHRSGWEAATSESANAP